MMADPTNTPKHNVIDALICKATRAEGFADSNNHYFAEKSEVDIFEVTPAHGGIVRSKLGDDEIRIALESDSPGLRSEQRVRIIFMEGFEQDPERLPMTSSLLEQMYEIYGVSPRFSAFLMRQRQPGRAVHYKPGTREMERHELWYSAVIRSHNDYVGESFDMCRMVVNWQRLCVWSDYSIDGRATFIIQRCPLAIKKKFYDAFQGAEGQALCKHPMLVHAFLAEHVVEHTYDFLNFFSAPMYAWEAKVNKLQSAEDYTNRSKAFLALSRQIHQVATDYDILSESIVHLQKQSAWFSEWLSSISGADTSPMIHDMIDAQRALGDAFENLLKEVKLIGTYSNLYLERTKIGVSECFAMVSQRDAELNIQMASESTTIARASHQDNQALRIIQILSMIFLPASLVSSIFGMGFFNTQPRDDGSAQFTISSNWWWYLAVSIPITMALLLYMVVYGYYTTKRLEKEIPSVRRSSEAVSLDLEAQLEKKIT